MANFGETSWGESSNSGKKFSGKKDAFLKLDNGANKVRILTKPYLYMSHKYKKEGDKGYGQKVVCSKTETTGCVLCDLVKEDGKPNYPQKRWFLGVLDRKTGASKILDISAAIKGTIDKLTQDVEDFGSPFEYDINIVVDRNGGATGYYTVMGLGKKPLTAAEQKLRDDFDIEDLKRRCEPLTPDAMAKKMSFIDSGAAWGEKPVAGAAPAVAAKATPAKAPAKKAAAPVEEEMTSTEDDTEFPAL